jgi:glucosamine--fructose-6-phosphate aminotransferase (isomerizing)
MCGIIGYIGFRQAQDILIEGLKSLEYRGYDSSGIALLDTQGEIQVVKSVGKITQLESKINDTQRILINANSYGSQLLQNKEPLISTCGIGHTRWATHGKPSDINSHPHQDSFGEVALVHNGIIKNYLKLKQELIANGEVFISETDTEVVVKLFAQIRKNQKN